MSLLSTHHGCLYAHLSKHLWRNQMEPKNNLKCSYFSPNSQELTLFFLYRDLILCNQIVYMQGIDLPSQKPRTYAKISLEDRIQLATLILEDSWSIGKSAKKVGIKLSTAKLIIKKYKEEGAFFESRTEKRKRIQNQETLLENHMENLQIRTQTEEDMIVTWPQSTQPCYFVEIATGLVYFSMVYNQMAGYYQ